MIVCVCVCVCVMQENVCIFLRVSVHVSEKKCALREKRHWARDIEQRRSMQKKAWSWNLKSEDEISKQRLRSPNTYL